MLLLLFALLQLLFLHEGQLLLVLLVLLSREHCVREKARVKNRMGECAFSLQHSLELRADTHIKKGINRLHHYLLSPSLVNTCNYRCSIHQSDTRNSVDSVKLQLMFCAEIMYFKFGKILKQDKSH